MIRLRRLTPALLNAWRVNQHLTSTHARCRLMWRENQAALAAIRNKMVAYFDEAFEDARRRIRRGFEDDLSPFSDSAPDPANYPALLHRVTMQGYLGETLAVLAVEYWGAHGHMDWIVPAFLFRLHDQEFQHLEGINERLRASEPPKPTMSKSSAPSMKSNSSGSSSIHASTVRQNWYMNSRTAALAHRRGSPSSPFEDLLSSLFT